MARALVVLACAAAAAATRYADYAGGKMPQYGAGGDYEAVGEQAPHSDDYHGHSPDAPASLDYKYQEELHSKTDKPSKNFDDADVWRKVRRKQRGLQRPAEHVDLDSREFNEDDDEAPRLRPSHIHAKRRPRLKSADHARSPPHRRSAKYSRDRQIEVSDTRDLDRDDISDNKSNAFVDDDEFPTTRRVNRRKARDRSMEFDTDLNTDEELVVADRRMKGDDEKEAEYPAPDTRRRRPPSERGSRERYRPVLDDDDARVQPIKQQLKIFDDFNDYYDMKRVQSIKQKLPLLLRRTSIVEAPTKTPAGTESMHALWANRRLGVEPSAPGTPAGSDSESDSREIVDIMASHILNKTSSAPSRVPSVTAFADTTGTIISGSSTIFAPANTSQELSLAEKSRLSILKKAQRKDGVKEKSTKKPPVLLQVTRNMATVIMVEPPVSRQPWLAPHVLTGESPGRIDRVKKLMRHKLVAQARSVQDLTDNWDEMVCDYIDVSLLDNGTSARFSIKSLIYMIFLPYVFMHLALS